MGDPKKIFESRDIEAAALYAKQVSSDAADLYPVLVDADGNLRVNMTVGTVSLSSTASVITNAAGNPVNVSLTNTAVTAALSTTKVTVDNTVTVAGTVTPSTTASTITNAVGNPVNVALTSTKVTIESASGFNVNVATATLGTVTVALSSTVVTVQNVAAGFNVNVATATLGTVTITGTVTPSTTASTITNAAGNPVNVSLTNTAVSISTAVTYSTVVYNSKTITTGTGSFSSTNNAITLTPSARAKVFAISLTTTSASELICVFNSGGVANGVELWRATLMAPAGASAGLNLAVSPPNFLFQSRSGTAVSLSLSTAALVHYSVSYFDES